MKEDAPRVIKIPAKPEATRQAEARRQLRVAAYCRVSTKEEDQACERRLCCAISFMFTPSMRISPCVQS